MKTHRTTCLASLALAGLLCLGLSACFSGPKKRAVKAATVGAVGVGASTVVKRAAKDEVKDKKPSVRDDDRNRRNR
jgi:hypothetical protein